jgi:hypothetical protein
LLHLTTQGRSKFSDQAQGILENTAKIYVRVLVGDGRPILAQLDTGSAWSVLAPEVVQELGSSLDPLGPASLSTRFGLLSGQLARAPITFHADEGEPLSFVGTFFVSEDWPVSMSFLGYSGLLEAIRFALDPQANDFYFGLPAES